MSRDYKKSPKRSARGGGSGRTVFTGILIGLLLGIIVALAIALFLNRSPSPFANRTQQTAESKKQAEVKKAPPKPAEPIGDIESPKTAQKPRFDFYEILPGEKDPSRRLTEQPQQPVTAEKKDKVEKPAKEIATQEEKTKLQPTPSNTAEAGKNSFYLQAGAFKSSDEANNLKARLALMGLEASVSSATVPNVGTMYRVRLGPYKSTDQVNSTKTQLAQNGIQAGVVKVPVAKTN